MEAHPITKRQKDAERTLWGHVQKEHIFTCLGHAERDGFEDLCVEKIAIYGSSDGIKILGGCYSIYGKRPARE